MKRPRFTIFRFRPSALRARVSRLHHASSDFCRLLGGALTGFMNEVHYVR